MPGIRDLVALPAGLTPMNPLTFGSYTVLGAGIWSVVLIAMGHLLGGTSD